MPALDDPNQLAYFRPEELLPTLKPITVVLKDGETVATLYPVFSADQIPQGLLEYLCEELNVEIERGQTYPLYDGLQLDTFRHYWFGAFAGVLLIGDAPEIEDGREWEKECLGTFYIKPNYPGRCSHVCNAGFLVNAAIRGKGIGRTLGELYLQWAPKLGYSYSVFNLVFETNTASVRIWDALGFDRIGLVKGAAKLKSHPNLVNAIIFGKELLLDLDPVEDGIVDGNIDWKKE
jgi:GNAT superfamily N-acetyltransferase